MPLEPCRLDRTVLAVPGVRDALVARRDRVVAVSPIVAGAALKGPADRLMAELGTEPSVVGVARLYAPWVGTLVVDVADASHAAAIEAEGVRCVVTPTVMSTPERAEALARTWSMPAVEGVQVIPITGLGEVAPGTDLAALIAGAVAPAAPGAPELRPATWSWSHRRSSRRRRGAWSSSITPTRWPSWHWCDRSPCGFCAGAAT